MPQLNPEFFLSQLFWLVVTFSFLLIFLWKISLPRISTVLDKREKKINEDIQSAKKLQTEAEAIQLQIDQQLHNTRNESAKLIKQSTINLQKNALSQLKNIDNELLKKIDEATNIIKKNKDNSIKDIKNQIQEVTKLTILKLSNIEVNDEEIEKAITKTMIKVIN